MSIDAQQLFREIHSLTVDSAVARWLVAFSGGMDSVVLLHALAQAETRVPIVAVHIDHGLHPDAKNWAKQCRKIAAGFDVEFICRSVQIESGGNSLEAAAREARYAEMATLLNPGDCLLTAHHQSDQAETLLINLMRGSGPAGLAGIGMRRSLGAGRLLRPLRDVSLDALRDYALNNQLTWIDDPSNEDTRFDRNFLRHEIIPQLEERWPAVVTRIARSAQLLGEANDGLVDLADIDLGAIGSGHRLSISALQKLAPRRQRNVLRQAIQRSGLRPAPATRLEQIVNELIPAEADRQPLVSWQGAEIRRFRDELFILAALEELDCAPTGRLTKNSAGIEMGPGMGTLSAESVERAGIASALVGSGLELRFRRGGETLRVDSTGGTRKLKKLLQESDVLPWMRSRLPLLFSGDQLVAVADLWIDTRCLETPGYAIHWRDAPVYK